MISVDLTALPQPMASAAASAGETWFFQVWYRDPVQSSNFSNALAVQLN